MTTNEILNLIEQTLTFKMKNRDGILNACETNTKNDAVEIFLNEIELNGATDITLDESEQIFLVEHERYDIEIVVKNNEFSINVH